jgi:hypothetical protein
MVTVIALTAPFSVIWPPPQAVSGSASPVMVKPFSFSATKEAFIWMQGAPENAQVTSPTS